MTSSRSGRSRPSLSLRLTLALVATFVVAVPFLLLLLVVEAQWTPLRNVDLEAATDLNEYAVQEPWLVDMLVAISAVFDPTAFRIVAVVLAIWLLRHRRQRLALWVAVTVLGGGLLVVALKAVVGRARPVLDDPVAFASGLSFPSGHALGATVGCATVLLVLAPKLPRSLRPWAWVLAAVIVTLVCFSRVGLGVHYVSDVLAGVVLGVAWVTATSAALSPWGGPPATRSGDDPTRVVSDHAA